MKSITKHTGELNITKRLPSSVNGNPRYEFTIDGHTACTTPDAMDGYGISNHDGKVVTVTLGTHYGRLSLNRIERSAK
jgi:hypothetical protein